MATVTGTLPNIFRWIFTVLVGLMIFAAFVVCVVMLINPHLPPGAHFGPIFDQSRRERARDGSPASRQR